MKRIVIILALLWATAAGAGDAPLSERHYMDLMPNVKYQQMCISGNGEYIPCADLKVEWGYRIYKDDDNEGNPFLVHIPVDIEVGLREDGVVVWRKKP